MVRSPFTSASRALSTSSKTLSTEAAKAASASKSNSNNENGGGENDISFFSYVGVLIQRLAMSLGIVYVVTEYGIEWTVCEGPSMMPTVNPRGEIVVIDRFTPRLWGLQGGDTVAKRAASAKRLQEAHVATQQTKTKQDREWLLRLYQQEEERLSQLDSQSSSSNSDEGSGSAEILRQLKEDLEQRLDQTTTNASGEELETWYEARVPVNRLSPEGAWGRFRTQISTGISVGDVVVLQHPDRIGTVCKRIMGLPGDVVTKPATKLGADRLEALLHGGGTPRTNQRTKRKVLAGGIVVPDGHIWVEGDNPWNSSDSRNYGAVPASLIMGRVLLRLWPLRGNALMERGDRPVHSDEEELSLVFSGSVVLPVGWDDQRILREEAAAPSTDDVSPARKQQH